MSLFSYRLGKKGKKTKQDKRIRRNTMVSDASGKLAQDGHYTVTTAVIKDPVAFGKITSEFPRSKYEVKFYNSDHNTRRRVLLRIAESDVDIYHRTYDMSELGLKTAVDRKDHYIRHMREVLGMAMASSTAKVIDLVFDNDIIGEREQQDFVNMCIDVARSQGKDVYWIEMVDSKTEPLVSVNDFITGVVARHLRKLDDPDDEIHELYEIIRHKIRN